MAAASSIITNASAWSNGGYSSDPTNPDYGTHDWIAEHALDWLPTQEKQYILDNLASYLYGTELPDNNQAPDGIGDTTKHHIYYNSSEVMTDDAAAVRASTEYSNTLSFLKAKDYAKAAKNAGIMSHYIADMAVFSHVMGLSTDWGAEVHHSDYETYVNSRTSSYDAEFNSYLSFDASLTTISAYDAAKNLAYDTTFDTDGDLTCVWMDQNYNWSNPTFKNRVGESLNLAVNYLTDVLHTLYQASIPDEAYITTVPYHPQLGGYYCGPASLEMVFDFYGPDIPQTEIADVARTAPAGTYTFDMVRATHFSNLSTSVGMEMPINITGYTARKLGYAAFEDQGMTIDELKSLIAAGYPIIVATTWHFRVAVGYNRTHITFQDSYYGKMFSMTYAEFDTDWDYIDHWALLVTPWKTEFSVPQPILSGSVFDITASITYPLPPPFIPNQYAASSSKATLTLPSGLSLIAGETAKKTIGTGGLAAGTSASVKWKVSADSPGYYITSVETEGRVEGVVPPLPSYPQPYSYTDRIGGAYETAVKVSGYDDEIPPVTADDYDSLWHTKDFTVTLTATDSQTGVAQTYYKINDASIKRIKADGQPIITDESADNKLEYWSVDNAGNEESHHILAGIKLDKTSPLGSITINQRKAHTTSTSVTLTLTATDATSGVYQVRYSNDGVWDTEPWEIPSLDKKWTLTPGDGIKTVYYQIKDNAGLTSITYADAIFLDTAPPTASITINEGATYTTTTSVTLTLSATDATLSVAEMRFSNDNTTFTEWQTYATSKLWTVNEDDGAKTVYAQFKDRAGLISTFSDTIILDTIPPTGSIKIAQNATYTNSLTVTLTLSTEDATSGVAKMRFSQDNTTWTPWEAYSTSKTLTLTTHDGTKNVHVQFEDNAGLTSQTHSDAIILDTTPPTVTITEPSEGSETKSSTLSVTWTSSDETSGIDHYEIRLDSGTWTNTETSTTYTFTEITEGTHTVDIKATDKAGNTKQETVSFTVNTSPLLGPGYTEEAAITAAIIIAIIGTGTYLLKTRKKR